MAHRRRRGRRRKIPAEPAPDRPRGPPRGPSSRATDLRIPGHVRRFLSRAEGSGAVNGPLNRDVRLPVVVFDRSDIRLVGALARGQPEAGEEAGEDQDTSHDDGRNSRKGSRAMHRFEIEGRPQTENAPQERPVIPRLVIPAADPYGSGSSLFLAPAAPRYISRLADPRTGRCPHALGPPSPWCNNHPIFGHRSLLRPSRCKHFGYASSTTGVEDEPSFYQPDASASS